MPALPNPLAVMPGATWRPMSVDDVAAFVRLHEAARVADGGPEVMTDEFARHELTNPDCPLATNSLTLVLADGSLAASMLAHERLAGIDSRRVYIWGVTHPEQRRRGIGSAILAWATARGDEILADQPSGLIRVVEAFIEARLADAVALYETAGFRPARWYVDMRRDLRAPLPQMPDLGGLRIEPYGSILADRVRLAHNEAFADHWGSEPLTAQAWARDFVGDPYFRGDLSFVAFDGPEIAGYSLSFVSEADWGAAGVREGWVGQLGVRRPWRKRGLATALLVTSMEAFRTAGLQAAALGVDVENPTGAKGIYERTGFRAIRRSVRMRRAFGG